MACSSRLCKCSLSERKNKICSLLLWFETALQVTLKNWVMGKRINSITALWNSLLFDFPCPKEKKKIQLTDCKLLLLYCSSPRLQSCKRSLYLCRCRTAQVWKVNLCACSAGTWLDPLMIYSRSALMNKGFTHLYPWNSAIWCDFYTKIASMEYFASIGDYTLRNFIILRLSWIGQSLIKTTNRYLLARVATFYEKDILNLKC